MDNQVSSSKYEDLMRKAIERSYTPGDDTPLISQSFSRSGITKTEPRKQSQPVTPIPYTNS